MTREDIEKMEPGRELDVAIAQKLFNAMTITKDSRLSDKTFYALVSGEEEGCQPLEKGKTLANVWWRHTGEEAWEACPRYSTDISAAWEVAEKLSQKSEGDFGFSVFQRKSFSPKWRCTMTVNWSLNQISVGACDTAAEAISKAALLAVMNL